MKKLLQSSILILGVVLLETGIVSLFSFSGTPLLQSCCAQDWKSEFDDICKKTTDTASLSKDELRQLISRSEKLRTVIETLEETEKKVYLRRLRQCQDLFLFILNSQVKE